MEQIKIKFIRMSTGEDLLTQIKEGNIGFKEFINPLKIVYTINPKTGKILPYLMRWVFNKFVPENTFSIRNENIIIETNTTDDMKRYYLDTLRDFETTVDKEDSNIEGFKQLITEGKLTDIKKHLEQLDKSLNKDLKDE